MRAAQPCVHTRDGVRITGHGLVDEDCEWYPQSDSNRQHTDFKSVASANWAMGAQPTIDD